MSEQAPGRVTLAPEKQDAGDERWALVMRVVASRGFARAGQLRDLLLYTAKLAIENPGAELSEQEIGSRVLGRKPDYDPQEDNIVRVQVRHLRQRLDEYFATQGAQEPLVITIPKGSRMPRFELRATSEAPAPAVSASPAKPAAGRIARSIGLPLLTLAACVGTFFAGLHFAAANRTQGIEPRRNLSNPLLARLFQSGQETTIVISDSSTVLLQDILQTSITANEYLDGATRKLAQAQSDPAMRRVLELLAKRQYTSLADATISSRFYFLARQAGARVSVRYARHMNVRDFHSGNYIFVGSKRGIPWEGLFEPDLDFLAERVGQGPFEFGFRNRRPRTGESVTYSAPDPGDKPHDSYATLALLPNLAHSGVVLLLNGASMESTEAAGEFAMRDEFPAVMEKVLGPRFKTGLPFFEILLRIHVTAGAPDSAEIVAWRTPDK